MFAPLPAGYGQILEVAAVDGGGQQQSLIVKEVSPPPGETGVGHDRKLHSYQVVKCMRSCPLLQGVAVGFAPTPAGPIQTLPHCSSPLHCPPQVESYFYSHLAPRLEHHPTAHVPRPLLVQSSLSAAHGGEGSMRLVLSDLRPKFPRRGGSLDAEHTRAVLAWLAAFHAAFWEQPTPAEVWAEGCYWHLATR